MEKIDATTSDIPAACPAKPAGKVRYLTIDHIDGRTAAMKRVRELMG
jgi:hypothetical protein